MSDMALWELIRASGLTAYVLLSASVAMGMAVRLKVLDRVMKRPWVFEAHQSIALASLCVVVLHVVLILMNSHVPFGLTQVLVPFSASWEPFASGLGTLSLYLATILVATSYARQLIGYKTWRAIHYGGFAAWVMALGHGIMAGTDSSEPWILMMYLATGAVVGLLIIWRVLEPSPSRTGRVADANLVVPESPS